MRPGLRRSDPALVRGSRQERGVREGRTGVGSGLRASVSSGDCVPVTIPRAERPPGAPRCHGPAPSRPPGPVAGMTFPEHADSVPCYHRPREARGAPLGQPGRCAPRGLLREALRGLGGQVRRRRRLLLGARLRAGSVSPLPPHGHELRHQPAVLQRQLRGNGLRGERRDGWVPRCRRLLQRRRRLLPRIRLWWVLPVPGLRAGLPAGQLTLRGRERLLRPDLRRRRLQLAHAGAWYLHGQQHLLRQPVVHERRLLCRQRRRLPVVPGLLRRRGELQPGDLLRDVDRTRLDRARLLRQLFRLLQRHPLHPSQRHRRRALLCPRRGSVRLRP